MADSAEPRHSLYAKELRRRLSALMNYNLGDTAFARPSDHQIRIYRRPQRQAVELSKIALARAPEQASWDRHEIGDFYASWPARPRAAAGNHAEGLAAMPPLRCRSAKGRVATLGCRGLSVS
jgi:hypothetical protein